MDQIRGSIARVLLALALLAVPAFAAAAGCGSPPDSSGDWQFVDDVALNMRLMSSSATAYGMYDTVDRHQNDGSTTDRGVTLSWSGYKTTTWSSTMRNLAGRTNTRERETVRVTVDVPPLKEAQLRVRDASRVDYYRFDAGCLWFNTQTRSYRRAVAEYGVRGEATRRWHASSLSIRTVW